MVLWGGRGDPWGCFWELVGPCGELFGIPGVFVGPAQTVRNFCTPLQEGGRGVETSRHFIQRKCWVGIIRGNILVMTSRRKHDERRKKQTQFETCISSARLTLQRLCSRFPFLPSLGVGCGQADNVQCLMPSAQCPKPNAEFPLPSTQCPMPKRIAQYPKLNTRTPISKPRSIFGEAEKRPEQNICKQYFYCRP